ncbi:4Fe-4S ferredoxin iron-sulfur binding domain protein [Desulfatibacillum aliphaticivorans]|uniref:4Fe-4S ferredoxin iron-sulfur binding domain protein n=1 Tax=Desulfatibacillum aliphaticivorans TaxID=218208 RepID=B8FL95_DESAL|nr:4Fe-4S binding protein [Desulfatibacillum aliphaticivorans]ACL04730.1 4Fe-4S ferredoxin iron-sulfur binding domain protein [Desulfatibacillum aliphaticivorans]
MEKNAYENLWERLNQAFTTAPADAEGNPHPAFMKYLELLYSPEEAEIMQHMLRPVQFSPSQEIAEASGKSVEYVEAVLNGVNKKNGLLAMGNFYALPPAPLLLNKHVFYPEIKPDDLKAAELYQDFFVKDGFYKYYEGSIKGTPIFRTIPVDKVIDEGQKVLEAEEAHEFILNHAPEEMALVPCPCRTRTEKMGIRECKDHFPVAACIMMGPSALHFESIGLGKRITREQAINYFDEMNELGLVGATDNTITDSSVICLCCECCCSQIRGRTRWDNPDAMSPSNFYPVAGEDCVGCGTCTERCFFNALTVDEETERAVVNPDECIGCGVCALGCPTGALKLQRLERSTPFATGRDLVRTIAKENRE